MILEEFERMGANKKLKQLIIEPGNMAYADMAYVPQSMDLESLCNSADCRSLGKPPVISHIHNGRYLWRSSELKSTYDVEKLADDVMLLNSLCKENEKLIIYSAREENGDTRI
jgi:hypothetical protein